MRRNSYLLYIQSVVTQRNSEFRHLPCFILSAERSSFISHFYVNFITFVSVSKPLPRLHLYWYAVHDNYRSVNHLNAELNPICYLPALLAHHFLHVSRIRVKSLTLRLLMSYIHGAPVLDVSRSHTTTQHSR